MNEDHAALMEGAKTRRKRIKQMIKQGYSALEIAADVNLSKQRVHRVLREENLVARGSRRQLQKQAR